MKERLGKLERVDLRNYWKDEARDFTSWLAKEENLELLGEALGLEIELQAMEANVGNFKADLVAKDIDSDRTVIIENQLDKSNHDHLRKIITYASGLNAQIVVWICENLTEEHRRAIDWLNEIAGERTAFFALEIGLWRIDDSPVAPRLNVVCRPNEWAEAVRESTKEEPTETKLLQLEFWSGLKDYMTNKETFLRLRKPAAKQRYSLSIGRSKFSESMTVDTQRNKLGCEIYLRGPKAKRAFTQLKGQQEEVELEIGTQLEWRELPEGQDSRIVLSRDGDVRNRDEWENYFQWYHDYAEKFYRAFSQRMKQLRL